MHEPRRGVTLLELLIAGMLTVVVILALGQVDAARIYLSERIRAGVTAESEASLVFMTILRTLQLADRINLNAPGSIQARIPSDQAGADLDAAASYRWVQYRLNAGQIAYYDPPCTIAQRFGNCSGTPTATDVCFSRLEAAFQDRAQAPPGIDPSPQDNNVLGVQLEWIEPKSGQHRLYIGEATMRPNAYSDVNAGAAGPGDSGTGLAPQGRAEPPTPC